MRGDGQPGRRALGRGPRGQDGDARAGRVGVCSGEDAGWAREGAGVCNILRLGDGKFRDGIDQDHFGEKTAEH